MSLISLSQSGALGTSRTAARPHLAAALYHAASAALTLTHAVAGWWHDRQTVRWLADADDAVLRDLGITRGDVARLVRMGRR